MEFSGKTQPRMQRVLKMHWKWFYYRNVLGDNTLHRSVMVNELDCNIIESDFGLESLYCIYFQTNAPWERYELPYPPPQGKS